MAKKIRKQWDLFKGDRWVTYEDGKEIEETRKEFDIFKGDKWVTYKDGNKIAETRKEFDGIGEIIGTRNNEGDKIAECKIESDYVEIKNSKTGRVKRIPIYKDDEDSECSEDLDDYSDEYENDDEDHEQYQNNSFDETINDFWQNSPNPNFQYLFGLLAFAFLYKYHYENKNQKLVEFVDNFQKVPNKIKENYFRVLNNILKYKNSKNWLDAILASNICIWLLINEISKYMPYNSIYPIMKMHEEEWDQLLNLDGQSSLNREIFKLVLALSLKLSLEESVDLFSNIYVSKNERDNLELSNNLNYCIELIKININEGLDPKIGENWIAQLSLYR